MNLCSNIDKYYIHPLHITLLLSNYEKPEFFLSPGKMKMYKTHLWFETMLS